MTGIPNSGIRTRPNRFQQYSLFDVIDRIHDLEDRLGAIESGIEHQKERDFENYIRNTGIAFATLCLAGYSISLALPDSLLAPISTVVGVAGVILLYLSLSMSRKKKAV